MLNAEQYEAYMFSHAKYYTITEFLGVAKYLTTKYSDLNICLLPPSYCREFILAVSGP